MDNKSKSTNSSSNNEFSHRSKLIQSYMKSNYRIIGPSKHSAIKPCHWLTEKLLTGRDNRNCYKGYFGIESETCIQNTPALPFCNHQCVFCWRDIENASFGASWTGPVDSPKRLVDEMIRHSINLVVEHITLKRSLDNLEIMHQVLEKYLEKFQQQETSREKVGFTISEIAKLINQTKTKTHRAVLLLKNCKVLQNIDSDDIYSIRQKFLQVINTNKDISRIIEENVTTKEEIIEAFKRAKHPKHAAISLAGEPTLYPKIGELVSEFRNRKMCTFIVTNGSNTDVIRKMWKENSLPTQLYVTLPAPTRSDFSKICRPLTKNSWENLNATLALLPKLPCRTVVRITSVKFLNIDLNMVEDYAKILKKNPPNFIDIKGFTVEANALELTNRLGQFAKGHELREFAPNFQDLLIFAKKLSEFTGFPIIRMHEASRDILLRANWPKNKSIEIDFEHV
ncbi:radical SAM protein [Candidatus Harpocratesius sp.]